MLNKAALSCMYIYTYTYIIYNIYRHTYVTHAYTLYIYVQWADFNLKAISIMLAINVSKKIQAEGVT